MKKHIFRSICLAELAVFLASFMLITGVLYDYFNNLQIKELKSSMNSISVAVENEGTGYLNSISDSEYRITLISCDGTVLYDNKTDVSTMKNHLERSEVKDALSNGSGESIRYSSTLMEKQLYYALRLSDGSVLRLSSEHLAWWALILGMIQPIALIIIIAICLSLFLAYGMSEKIIKPFNRLRFDGTDESSVYEELTPLLKRLSIQKNLLEAKQNELYRKKKEFEAATESMSEGIILLGENDTVISINRKATEIIGVSKYCVGKDITVFNINDEIRNLLTKAKTESHCDEVIEIKDRKYHFSISAITGDTNANGIALIITDITEESNAEEIRRRFTSNVSHELKTPLQTISGYAELLSGGMVKPEDTKIFYDKIYIESKRMSALIDDIIRLSHLEEPLTSYTFEKTDVYEIAKEVQERLKPFAENRNIQLNLRGERAVINGVPRFVSEIVYNLCENAIKYNIVGGSVRTTVENKENAVILTVKDTGIGISDYDKEHIFERFYRTDKSHSKTIDGTGLGLSIVKHAVMVHNAEISVESEFGKGSEFTVTFHKT